MSIVAVIDLGSNTSKLTVIEMPGYKRLHHCVRHTRIAEGMGHGASMSEAAIMRCVQAIQELQEEAAKFSPNHLELVATSAVRDAHNRGVFVDAVYARTGLSVDVLSGAEEARLIALGATTDPTLSDIGDSFSVFDLGGGSLECIDYFRGEVRQLVSLPLGAVRLNERYIEYPEDIIAFNQVDAVFGAVQDCIKDSDFKLQAASHPFIGMGGAFVVARSILAAKKKRPLEHSIPILDARELGDLLTELCGLEIEARAGVAGMTAERADIMPAALAIILAVADMGRVPNFLHSFHNLPYGIAAEFVQN